MRSSRKQVSSASHSIPKVRFAEHALTSFGGLVVFQAFLQSIDLRARLRASLRHLSSSAAYDFSRIVLLMIVHTLLGWRRLRDLDYYRDDPFVLRVLGLRRLPDVSTVSRRLGQFDGASVDKLRDLLRDVVGRRVCSASPARVTLDFDGSVLSTKARGIEGTAVGYNTKRKGCRSYYPLFAMVAQTGQVFDVFHRAGNCHDSRGAAEFMLHCFEKLREKGFRGQAEARMDSAHFSDATCSALDDSGVEFSITVPFERLSELKEVIERRRVWQRIDDRWSCFQWMWSPVPSWVVSDGVTSMPSSRSLIQSATVAGSVSGRSARVSRSGSRRCSRRVTAAAGAEAAREKPCSSSNARRSTGSPDRASSRALTASAVASNVRRTSVSWPDVTYTIRAYLAHRSCKVLSPILLLTRRARDRRRPERRCGSWTWC